MALATSSCVNPLHCTIVSNNNNNNNTLFNNRCSISFLPPLHTNFPKTNSISRSLSFFRPLQLSFSSKWLVNQGVACGASSAAGNSSSDNDFNPYEVLGVNPIEGFDKIKVTYQRKRKDAERRGDYATADRLESAYDKLMMLQLSNRKKGITAGSFQVSKDIKYADKQPLVPWGPRFAKSEVKDMQINMAISAAFIAWILIKRTAEWQPVQFISFVYVYRIFEKLKTFEAPVSTFTEEGEEEGRLMRMGKRLLRSLSLVFGCIAVSSLGYTGVINGIELVRGYIPTFLYNNQELLVTATTSITLYIIASYYR